MIFRPTRLAFAKWYLIGFAFFALSLLIVLDLPIALPLGDYKLYMILSMFVAVLACILIAEVMRRRELYAITSTRIVEKSGIINTDEDSIYWEKLSNYSVKQGLIERILNIGTIELWAIGGDEKAEITIQKASNIKKIVTILDKLIQKR
jgi:uncharacterized membrane protein YdbT with pleckstrin-like domain